jgi:hypothetical protein
MDTNKAGNNFVCDTPTSAFTRYVRPRQSTSEEIKGVQNTFARRRSAFARIKQLFRLQSSDATST